MLGKKIVMKRVITYGTFDTFHYGHYFLLERAKSFGEDFTVAISTDEFNTVKGKKALVDFATRKRILQSLKFVTRVIPEYSWEQKIKDVKNLDIDIFVMGHDWEGKFDFLTEYCEVIYLPRTPDVSSTFLRSSKIK
jgi:glycerol-3-phosphate cytidylyltransferase